MMGDWAVQTLLASWWVEFDGTPYGANDVADKDTYVLNLSGCYQSMLLMNDYRSFGA